MAAQAKLEDSNIAMLGSDLEKEVRLNAAKTEKEWEGAGKAAGIDVWRVEKLGIKRWPKEQYGSFYSGDSYIVLHSYKDSESDKLLHNVHFWLGRDTSQDEAGVAAYKTVELDDLLGQLPVQFREVQDHESEDFLELWKPPMRTMDGGIESGFNKVEPTEYKPRLIHLKGKKNVRCTQVKTSRESLNDGDSFVLDCGLDLVQWNGASAGVFEKRKANELISQIKEERNGRPKSVVIDGDEDHELFWKTLGGKGAVKSAEAGGSDDAAKAYVKKLLKVSDASGSLTMSEIQTGSLSKAKLDTNDVFIVDTAASVFVWIGSGASKNERAQAFKFANQFLVDSGRPFSTPVVRVVEGSSCRPFEAAFSG